MLFRSTPFNTKKDKLDIDFKIYQQDPTVTRVVIETVRVLQGQQQLAEANVNLELDTTSAKTASIQLPAPTDAEEETNPSINVWYMYVQNEQEKRGTFQKALGKITLIAAD